MYRSLPSCSFFGVVTKGTVLAQPFMSLRVLLRRLCLPYKGPGAISLFLPAFHTPSLCHQTTDSRCWASSCMPTTSIAPTARDPTLSLSPACSRP